MYSTNSYLIFENRWVVEYKIPVALCSCGILVAEELCQYKYSLSVSNKVITEQPFRNFYALKGC